MTAKPQAAAKLPPRIEIAVPFRDRLRVRSHNDHVNHRIPSPPIETPLLEWLLAAMKPMNRTRVKECLRSGRVLVNGVAATRHDHPLKPGDLLTLASAATPQASLPHLPIVYEDDAIIVVDKPVGLLAVATDAEKRDTAFVRLATILESRNGGRPFVVHRLDRDTSGLLLFARHPEIRDRLQAGWDAVEKTYFAIVEGTPPEAAGTIENHLIEGDNLRVRIGRPGGASKLAITHYRLLETRGRRSILEVRLGTGRKHQIRVHLASLGCPIVGDADYGARSNPAHRLGLHAWRLAFDHPATGVRLDVESPIPKALKSFSHR